MPPRGRAGGKSRGPRRAARAAAGVILGLFAGGCTTPTVAARAVWIGGEHGVDGSRTLFVYASGEITTSTLRPQQVLGDTDDRRFLVEVAPRGAGALLRGVDEGWLDVLGGEAGFRGGYIDLDSRRVVPLQLAPEVVPANVARFAAAGDALVWAETCPPGLAVVPLAAEVGLTIDEETGGAVPLRSAGKPAARAGCSQATTPAVASAADAPVVFRVDAAVSAGETVAQAGGEIEALRYPTGTGDAGLQRLGAGRLPAGHRPVLLAGAACADGDPGCGLALVDPDGAAISFAVRDGGCRLMRWAVGEAEARCVIAGDAAPELQAERVVAAISPEHYVLYDGQSLHRYDWATGEVTSRPLVGDPADGRVRATADGRAVVLVRGAGPMLRVDADSLEVINVVQRDCSFPQAPQVSPSGRVAAWSCTIDGETFPGGEGLDGLEYGDVVRVSPAGMERFDGIPMWVVAVDDEGGVMMHSRRIGNLDGAQLGENAGTARNLYVLAADGELARISPLEPDPEPLLGLSPGTVRRIAARSL
jgi:hypothetical protein